MSNRRGGRARIKIAILDTGIDENDTWLNGALSAAIKERENQGFQDAKDTNPIKDYWPSTETSVLDECGHGTHMAYLLLRYAPDADLYIAKVSDRITGHIITGVLTKDIAHLIPQASTS